MLPDDDSDREDDAVRKGCRESQRELLEGPPFLKVYISFPPLQSAESTSQRCYQIPSEASSHLTSTNSGKQIRLC